MPAPRRRFVWEIDWNLLRTFMVIVQERSLTAAGERLGLKQPTISNALKRLEGHMGCRLIDRSAAGFAVTPVGQRLHADCLALFGIVSGLAHLEEDRPDQITGQIELALASHVVCPLLDEVLRQFHRDYPRIRLSIQILTSAEVQAAVLTQEAAVGVCLLHERSPRLEYHLLYREEFGYFCAPGHPLYGQSGLPLAALSALPYVSFRTDRMSDALWPVALLRQQAGFHGEILGVSSHLEEVKRLISTGFGFGPLPVHVVAEDVAAGRLWRLPPYESPPLVDVFLVLNPQTRKTTPESLLTERLRAAIGALPIEKRTYPLVSR